MPVKATEDDVLRWLALHFRGQSWAAVPQVTVSMPNVVGDTRPKWGPEGRYADGGGNLSDRLASDKDRRIDMLLARSARNAAYGPIETMAVEVKVTRQDFLNDVRNPSKQAPWRAAATRHTYAVPAGLVQAHEVPEESGLLWLAPNAYVAGAKGMPEVTWARRAPYRKGHAPQLPARVQIAMLHRASDFECDVRGWNLKHTATESPEELRATIRSLQRDLSKAQRRADKQTGTAEAWKFAYGLATPHGVPCGICGRPVKPKYPKEEWFREWAHLDPADDVPCATAEEAERVTAAKAEYEAALADGALEAKLRSVHRFQFNEAVAAEPWRAYMSRLARTPYPTNVPPTGDPA